jgi:hypothetical protein
MVKFILKFVIVVHTNYMVSEILANKDENA